MGESSQDIIEQLRALFAPMPEVRFAYLFGSHARDDAGPLSDLDVAVFLSPEVSAFDFRLQLMETLARALGTDHLDLVTLNDAPPVLKYEVIRHGRIVKEDREARIPFEAHTLSEYFDTEHLRRVQRMYLKKQFETREDAGMIL
ncbi:MAG: nucleotidyltransferase domain-containing protein [Geoalkalibacter sp.]|jgi:predicted nucleotidyltransferase|uniref:type VII toxin-antitoxin system MntA family adenylyltransferase antitoxin n=1 Tax=Geoalkalibacter sp. TaxID=3041440 RepID=UPI002A97A67E|nr:nucleotidyltransferase domain-containing protein [Thermodesulfobacteriota bacterium]